MNQDNNKQTEIIETIVNQVSTVIKDGVDKLLYNYAFHYLTNELEKRTREIEYYKNELNRLKMNKNRENIIFKIEEKTENLTSIISVDITHQNSLENDDVSDVTSETVSEDDNVEPDEDAEVDADDDQDDDADVEPDVDADVEPDEDAEVDAEVEPDEDAEVDVDVEPD
jgi:homoaconitase/3-isopropylmalate dehydratase large subunit